MIENFKKEILALIFETVEVFDSELSLHEPVFSDLDKQYVLSCIESGWVSSAGNFLSSFEEEIAKICGTKFAVALINGTAALELALRAVGVQPKDEVICPSLTFVATANAISHIGALPNFVDSEKDNYGIDALKLRKYLNRIAKVLNGKVYNKDTGNKISAIVAVHVFGHPIEFSPLKQISMDYGIPIVEDAAEALGSLYKEKPCGSLGAAAAFSFNGNKIITTGAGGALTTNDEAIARAVRHLATTAKLSHKWRFRHDQIGFNYRMANLNAALGLAQIQHFPKILMNKRALAKKYLAFPLASSIGEILSEPKNSRSNYWLNSLKLSPNLFQYRDEILDYLHENNVYVRPAWDPLHTLGIYRHCPKDNLENTENLVARTINLPSSSNLISGLEL
ncbi:LegC family aminotransferase [Paracoccaceae bacterium]|nr:LegC family aminotransferase [Paracoccaceae bacterium]